MSRRAGSFLVMLDGPLTAFSFMTTSPAGTALLGFGFLGAAAGGGGGGGGGLVLWGGPFVDPIVRSGAVIGGWRND